jgi:LmbE family N-acetylglucosaminyl deacetylase
MAVHAHPDDEATGTGGILARCAAEGIQTVLVTCTDGACGDGLGGAKPGEAGHDPAAVIAMRQRELESSCAVLNVTHLELLGYGDSGMMGWPSNDALGSFWTTPVDDAAARLGELMQRYQPDDAGVRSGDARAWRGLGCGGAVNGWAEHRHGPSRRRNNDMG